MDLRRTGRSSPRPTQGPSDEANRLLSWACSTIAKDAHSATLTHVLLSHKEASQPGAKVQVALSRASSTSAAIAFVSLDWLLDSAAKGTRQEEAQYDVRRAGAAASTETGVSGRRSARVGKVDAGVKRERSQTPPPLAKGYEGGDDECEEEEQPQMVRVQVNGTVPVHPRFPHRGQSHSWRGPRRRVVC